MSCIVQLTRCDLGLAVLLARYLDCELLRCCFDGVLGFHSEGVSLGLRWDSDNGAVLIELQAFRE